ncbi:MAG: ABC transporter ATP-binding protein [Bryobacterales bacterium]|nr:ABC transporter ATP-binding protein [Bryobacteraceae bacterium]MDW8356093.1 ABC transporter ATP-binding protein [Bryobacterales bacterium]
MSQPLLQARGVCFSYGAKTALTDVHVRAGEGEFIAIVGRNGSGKSTLLNLMAGLLEPRSGEVLLAGRPLGAMPARRRAAWISHLPQTAPGGLGFTVEQVVLMGRYASAEGWFESACDRQACLEAMARLGLDPLRDRRISALSGGERQRALLASCLAQSARAMLLDEPAASLDIDHQLDLMELLRQECDRGRLVIVVMHDLNLALRYCSRLLVVEDGGIAADLSAKQAWADASWLNRLSARLQISFGCGGKAWVSY